MSSKRFTPKSSSKTGTISSKHTIRLSDGTTQVLSSKPRSVRKGEKNDEVRDAKRRILNRLSRQEGRIRGLVQEGVNTFEREIHKVELKSKRDKDGKLKVVEKSKLTQSLEKVVRGVVRDVRDEIFNNLKGSIKTYLIGVRRGSPKGDLLSMKEIEELSSRIAVSVYKKKTGKNNKTTANRLGALGANMEVELSKLMDKTFVERFNYRSILKKKLIDPKGSGDACVSRGVARISRTEQNRAIHEATLEVMKIKNISLAYWRLSASHVSYGGAEVCEVLAVGTGLGVEDVVPSGVSILGLYMANSFPSIPHPNCMCSIEPLYI